MSYTLNKQFSLNYPELILYGSLYYQIFHMANNFAAFVIPSTFAQRMAKTGQLTKFTELSSYFGTFLSEQIPKFVQYQ